MAKQSSKQTAPTRKHLARMEREKIQQRYIIIGSIVIIIAVVALIGYGILYERVLQGQQAVAFVNGEKITLSDFQAQTRYARYSLINNAQNLYQFSQMFAGDPNSIASITTQLAQIDQQLQSASIVGEQTLNQMIETLLLQQEASQLAITLTDEEVDKTLEEAFGFFEGGTPTPSSTHARPSGGAGRRCGRGPRAPAQ